MAKKNANLTVAPRLWMVGARIMEFAGYVGGTVCIKEWSSE